MSPKSQKNKIYKYISQVPIVVFHFIYKGFEISTSGMPPAIPEQQSFKKIQLCCSYHLKMTFEKFNNNISFHVYIRPCCLQFQLTFTFSWK